MAFDARLREAGQVLVGDGGDVGDLVSQVAEAGSEDDPDARFGIADATVNDGGGFVGSRSCGVQIVGAEGAGQEFAQA